MIIHDEIFDLAFHSFFLKKIKKWKDNNKP